MKLSTRGRYAVTALYTLAKERRSGPIAFVDCMKTDSENDMPLCSRHCDAAARGVWANISRRVNEVLNSITLADLCSDSCNDGLVAGSDGSSPINE